MANSVTLNFRAADGQIFTVNVSPGQSVMEAAVLNGVPGIEGECGGCLSCATCHVLAPEGLGAADGDEEAMLDFTEIPRSPESRLACQIEVTAAMDGLVFGIPRPA